MSQEKPIVEAEKEAEKSSLTSDVVVVENEDLEVKGTSIQHIDKKSEVLSTDNSTSSFEDVKSVTVISEDTQNRDPVKFRELSSLTPTAAPRPIRRLSVARASIMLPKTTQKSGTHLTSVK
uniref:Uncharacterized protein n=1 Tax=Caenorhabditis japonica TaxID=281687 RepID=A0A8R1IIJ9_CAEJA